jgi:hypothetical protein
MKRQGLPDKVYGVLIFKGEDDTLKRVFLYENAQRKLTMPEIMERIERDNKIMDEVGKEIQRLAMGVLKSERKGVYR